MDAEIIAIGSEMLTAARVDTNSLWLTDQLNALGIEVVTKMVVGDDRPRLAGIIRESLRRVNLLIITGGLGPTEDDITREATADALGRGLVESEAARQMLVERFKRYNRPMAANNLRQSLIVDGAEMLPNANGSAPGEWIANAANHVALLPGPPHEMRALFEQQILPRLRPLAPPLVIRSLHYRVAGLGESDLDNQIAPIYRRYQNPTTTVLAKPGDIQVLIRARRDTESEAQALLDEVGGQIESVLGDKIYARDATGKGAPSLEEVVGTMLNRRGETLVVAESCTGGMLADRITAIPGCSAHFLGGFVTYTETMKQQQLGVPRELIDTYGVVSEEVAHAMARGAAERTGATHALSISGFAGPDGGTEKAPVGTVCLGYAGPNGASKTRRFHHPGDRTRVRQVSVQYALDLLRRHLANI